MSFACGQIGISGGLMSGQSGLPQGENGCARDLKGIPIPILSVSPRMKQVQNVLPRLTSGLVSLG